MGNRRQIARNVGLIVLSLVLAGPARAQVAPSDLFTEPVLILTGDGHHAPVRSMLFTPDGAQLLTGGMDKVVRVWNLGADRTRLARTLRPPIWRGGRGEVNALAISPRGAEDGRRLLAVAGYGVLADRGEILLFDDPGQSGQGTGDVRGQLSARPAVDGHPGEPGHSDVVTSMAFTPDGKYLASASNDRTVRIWDVAGRRQVSVMDQATGPINSIAIFAEGTRLVAGGRDATLRLYDISDRARPRFLAQSGRTPGNPLSGTILSLAVTPDNRWIFVGTEGAGLIRYETATMAGAILKASPGPVLAVAVSPNGQRLATSSVARKVAGRPDDPQTLACLVEVRSVPDARVLETMPATSNLVFTLAFSPDSRRLAYSGGDSQAIYLKSMAENAPPPEEIPGQGSSLWDVGFRSDSQAVRFARIRPQVPGQAENYEAFDLRGRFLFDPEPGEPAYRHATAIEAGWTIRPIRPGLVSRVDFLNSQGQGWPGQLDLEDERRYYSYTLIPPNAEAGHLEPVAAVGCETGVVLWNLANGRRTRFLNGHSGPVYSMASSPDGKWLVTGSSDQTLRLWPLAGCDRPAPFGARFDRRADGVWIVGEVTPGGFADGIKLKPGQVIEKFFVGPVEQSKAQTDAILPVLDAQPPTTMFSLYARMGQEPELLRAGSTKRDSPALTLFPAADREWVLWTPRGHYDTSVEGDRKYLGWLTNRGSVAQLQSARFDTIDKFEKRFRQPKAPAPNVLDRLLDTGDPLGALAALLPVAPTTPGPRNSGMEEVALTPGPSPDIPAPVGPAPGPGNPALAVGGRILLDYAIRAATGAARIARASILVDGKSVAPIAIEADGASVAGRVDLPVPGGRASVLTLETVDTLGVVRTTQLPVSNPEPPAPGRRASRLEIIAIGSESFADKRLPPIPHARRDAEDLAQFLKDRLIDPATGSRFAPERVRVRTFVDREVAAGPLTEALDDLRSGEGSEALNSDDVVALVLETHFFSHRSEPMFATAEPPDDLAPPSISAADLSERLGTLARLGCRVVVLLDSVHKIESMSREENLEIKDWIRQLQANSHVASFIAADHGPSRPIPGPRPSVGPHRAFAEGFLSVLEARSAGRLRTPGNGPMTLFEFQRTLIDSVLERTGRKQHARGYLPETISMDAFFLDAREDVEARPVSLKD
ncbi:WD40 repeat domain-containing protein [Tundrisphaera lichenicola]|uniref:WD40 repeat domain-containing protein n=1 Tax=Tundrisphaera lichenicola TaxID=2029860 RepID=UPI003EBED771